MVEVAARVDRPDPESAEAHITLPAEIALWLDQWRARQGHGPRILHIGNIANNAYNNAKLFIKAGFDCDVICYDYYHIMGCPEWEDADFDGGFGDHFYPEWGAVEMQGYARPRWFAQGPAKLCIGYLIARRSGQTRLAASAWDTLQQLNGCGTVSWIPPGLVSLCRTYLMARIYRNPTLADDTGRRLMEIYATRRVRTAKLRVRWLRFRLRTYYKIRRALSIERFGELVDQQINAVTSGARRLGDRLVLGCERLGARTGRMMLVAGALATVLGQRLTHASTRLAGLWMDVTASPAGRAIARAGDWCAQHLGLAARWLAVLCPRSKPASGGGGTRRWGGIGRLPAWCADCVSRFGVAIRKQRAATPRLLLRAGASLGMLVTVTLSAGGSMVKFVHRQVVKLILVLLTKFRTASGIGYDKAIIAEAIAHFKSAFPERLDPLKPEDVIPYLAYLEDWKKLFQFYDVIVGYSTDPILPMLAGSGYFAFEHGTLREIPFRTTAQGRLAALAYHRAEHAFVTNFDCIDNARLLCGPRHSFMNHPYDEDHGLTITGVDVLRRELCAALDAEFLIFFPTRQDWVAGTGYADKANDVLLKAFCRLRAAGYRLGMVCCAWGRNVGETRELLAAAHCLGFVKWYEPMGVIRFERMARACDVVADQFKLGAFGGVTFKALAVGAPVCTYLDPVLLEGLYPQMPPVINCRTEDDIMASLRQCLENGERLRDLGRASRAWIKQYHSGREVVVTQARQFKIYLEKGQGSGERLCAVN